MAGKRISVEVVDRVAVLTMKNNENRLNPEFMSEFHSALDEVIQNQEVIALITTGEKKFFSNGLDLENMRDQNLVLHELCRLVARLITFPMPTVAAINGHAFAGGAMVALAHDYRVMNSHRGWITINEVHMPARIPIFLLESVKFKLPQGPVHTEVITMGKRFTGPEAQERGLVQAVALPEDLLSRAKQLLRDNMKLGDIDRDAIGWMKRDLYAAVLDKLEKGYLPRHISSL